MSTHASSVRCCKNEESLKPGVVLAWLVRAQKLTCGFSIVLLGSSSTESTPRDCLQDFATLNAQTTRHGARPGPKLAPSVQAGPLRDPKRRARGKTHGRRRRACTCPKQNTLIRGSIPGGMYQVLCFLWHVLSPALPFRNSGICIIFSSRSLS